MLSRGEINLSAINFDLLKINSRALYLLNGGHLESQSPCTFANPNGECSLLSKGNFAFNNSLTHDATLLMMGTVVFLCL